MFKINKAFKNGRLLKSLIGMGRGEFEILLGNFSILLKELRRKPKVRRVGGGRKGALTNAESKLFFILFYIKVYPTCDLGAFIFNVDRSQVNRWVNRFMTILEKALGRSIVMPERRISSMEEFLEKYPEVKDMFVDATERKVQRPKNKKLIKKRYSGKKKCHTRKNTIICNEKNEILFTSKTKDGRIHDLKQLRKMEVLDHIPKNVTLWLDKGYQGINKYLKNDNPVMMPKKKSPKKQLTYEQKQENSAISSIRMRIEKIFAGIKKFSAMSQIYRNKKGQDDQIFQICSGIWNLQLHTHS